MDLFFNELSIKEGNEKEAGKLWMTDLINVFKKASEMGFKELKTTEAFLTFPLATGYIINDWLFDSMVDREARIFVKTKVSRSPFIDELMEQKDNENNLLHEFKYKEQKAIGLGAACLFDSVALSFANSIEWDNHLLELCVTELSEDDPVIDLNKKVSHASKPAHLDFLKECIKKRKRSDIPNGKLLWLKRNEYFPHLIFCANVEKQISSLFEHEPEFHAIVKRLFEMEDISINWKIDIFSPGNRPSKVTPESESRISRYKDELTIICPDGKSRFFSSHFRYTPGAGRIHFAPDNAKKRIYIGYIGSKIQ